METNSGRKVRLWRSEEQAIAILDECSKSNLSIKDFCAANHINPGTFHHWKKKYRSRHKKKNSPAGFASLHVEPSFAGPGLFALVNGISIYQPVTAAYLKELLA